MKKKQRSVACIYGQHSTCWLSHNRKHHGCPKTFFQYGSSKTCRRFPRSSALIPSLSAQTSTSQSRSGLFGQPHLHMPPKSGDKLPLDTELLPSASPANSQVYLCGDPRASTVRHPNNTISILFKRDNPLNPLNRVSHLPMENGVQFTKAAHDRIPHPQQCGFTFGCANTS